MTTPAKHDIERRSLWLRFRASAAYDPATRVVHSFWQVALVRLLPLLTLLSATGTLGPDSVGPVLLAALYAGLGAGIISLGLSLATWKVPELPRWADTLVRLVRTVVAAVIGQFAAAFAIDDQALVHFGWFTVLCVAIGAALLSLVKTQFVNSALGIGGAFRSGFTGVPANPDLSGDAGVPAPLPLGS